MRAPTAPRNVDEKEADTGRLSLRRDKGGEGKAHTLNEGLDEVMEDDWAQALLIIDADVVFEPTRSAGWRATSETRTSAR